jgi:hypothetical protein
MRVMWLSKKLINKYTFRGLPIFHLEWVHKYPRIYFLNIWLFQFTYKFKFNYKFPFDDMCFYQIMVFNVEKCVLAMVGANYSEG